MKAMINEKFELIFISNKGNTYEGSSFYDDGYINFDLLKIKNINIIERTKFSIKLELEKEIIQLALFSIKCNFKDMSGIFIYSIEHLDLILKKMQYNNPFYISKYSNEFNKLDDLNSKWDIFIEEEITIEEFLFSKNENKKIYDDQIKLLNEFKKLIKENYSFSYNIISYNIRNYLELLPNADLNEKFHYVNSPERIRLEMDVNKFLLDNDNYIYAIYGPYGIGKSLTALIIQKYLFINNYKSIYINLKYFAKNISLDSKFQTLISECFFLCENPEELEEYHKLLLGNKSKNIWYCLQIIYNHLKDKKKELSQYLFIIDQYKMNYDENYSVLNFPNLHIFILSSINDKDIKNSLISMLKGIKPKIKYHFIEKLIKDTFKGIILKYKEKIVTKISGDFNMTNDEKFEFISCILNLFGNLPRFISLLLNKYSNIFDLLNEEYKKIFSKIFEFFKYNNVEIVEKLKNDNFLSSTELKSLKKYDFASYLSDIPLKYIKFFSDNNQYYLNYSFPLCEKILEDYILFNKSINTFKIINKDNPVGINFEFILNKSMRVFELFKIDGYIEVNSIVELKLNDNYKYIDKNYFNSKNNVLIAQSKPNGKAFDFCIYKTVQQILILLQSKYIINNDNVDTFLYYKKYAEIIVKLFKDKFEVNINKIYFLYISSYEYNINRKEDVLKCLNSKQINCIFYSIFEKIASFNFKDSIIDIPLNDSYIIYPYAKNRVYLKQWEEKHIMKENKNLWNSFLNKKHFQEHNIKNYKNANQINDYRRILYEKFLKIIKKEYSLISDFFDHFGMFFKFYFESYGESITIYDYDIYIFVFKTKAMSYITEIDESKDLGIIYSFENKICFFDIKNKEFLDESEFNKKFNGYSFTLGKYI